MHLAQTSALGPRVRLAIFGLGITQIIGWGSTYYLLSLLAPEIGRALGLSSAATLAGASLPLVAAALFGPRIGRWQDRAGSRVVMSTGSIITGLGLGLLGFAPDAAFYYLAWSVIAIGGPMILYSAAFTALTQIAGAQARRAISFLTFMGGLASTIFWPFTAWLQSFLDWRSIAFVFAVMHLVICLGIHLRLPATGEARSDAGTAPPALPPGLPPEAHLLAFLLLAAMLALNGLIFNAWSLLVFEVLKGIGFVPAAAIAIGSLVGAFQVAGRVGELLFGGRYSAMWTGLISAICLPVAFMVLQVSGGGVGLGGLFAALYGISNGLLTIARGALVLAMFGTRGYGERLNRVTVAQNAAGAVAPILGGFLLDRLGAPMVVSLMFATALVSLALMLLLRRHCARNGLT
ncbi:MFS transporter [Rhabdaerophilum calidifontis]|uniref:MFS transporter n=1 Tax=Rhabdaerophilum calidifontis TaxID=2604328 RepID=UPI00123A8D22|nr:MFS transporter [Rhabdaerophilum calidifontis]